MLEKFCAVQAIDVVCRPRARDHLTCYTQPEPELKLLIEKLKPTLPAQPPPKISAAQAARVTIDKELATRGMGYAILPLSHFRHEYEQGALTYAPIVKPSLTLTTFLSYRTNSRAPTSRAEGLVIEVITRMLTEMRKP